MAQKNYNYAQEYPLVQRKSQPLSGFKGVQDFTKYSRQNEPFRNSSNHDSISMRLEEIKRKYSDTNKPGKWNQNVGLQKDKQSNQNRQTVSQIKTKSKHYIQSPQKSITKTRIQVSNKSPYGSIKHKSFTAVNDFQYNKTPKRIQNIQTQQNMDYGDRPIEDQRTGAIQKINYKIKSILDGINMGKRQINTIEVKQISLKSSPKNETRLSGRLQGSPGIIKQITKQVNYSHSAIKQDYRHYYDKNTYNIQTRKQRSTSAIRTDIEPKEKRQQKLCHVHPQEKKKLTGKQLDDEIFKIQERIKKSSDQRQRLTEMLDKKDRKDIPLQKKEKQYTIERSQNITQKKYQHIERIDRKVDSKIGRFEQKIYSVIQNNVSAQNSNQKSMSNPYYSRSSQNNPFDQYKNRNDNIKQASEFSLKLHPIPCDEQFEQQTHKLAVCLSEQVKIDQQLRNARIWLQHLNDSNKWTKLTEYLSRSQRKHYSQQQIKQIFKHTQQQHNPFFFPNSNQSIQGVVQKYIKAEQYWNSKIIKKFNSRKLNQQGFGPQTLDLEEKGYIQTQDFVRFLNIQTGNFYRTRDIILIFKRLTKGNNRLNFQEFIKVVADGVH